MACKECSPLLGMIEELQRKLAVQRMALALVDESHKNQQNWVTLPGGQRARLITAEERKAVIEALDNHSRVSPER